MSYALLLNSTHIQQISGKKHNEISKIAKFAGEMQPLTVRITDLQSYKIIYLMLFKGV